MVTEEKQDRAVLHGSVGLDGVTLDYIYLSMSLTNISRAAKLKNDHSIFLVPMIHKLSIQIHIIILLVHLC